MQKRILERFLKIKKHYFAIVPLTLGALFFVGTMVHGIIPFTFWKTGNVAPPTFLIDGVSGGTDSTQDAWLANGTNPTIHFATLAGATGYDIVIKDSAGVVTQCSSLNQPTSPVSPSSCGLTNGATYRVYVKALPSNINAYNDDFSFTVDNLAPTTNTISGITGASDGVADTWLTGGLLPTVNWNVFTNATSYDITIKDATGTTTVCATQNTTSTSYNFSVCTLTNGTGYRAYVTAKSTAGFQTTNASNTGLSFTVDNTAPGGFSITGITGGSDALVDAYLADGTDPTVVYGTASNVYRYDLTIKDSTGTTTICSLANQTGSPTSITCGLTSDLIYKAYITAKSISGFLTTSATNNGFSFTVSAPAANPPSNFMVLGASGGTDDTPDNWLTSGSTVTATWTFSSGATSYDATIRNSTDTADVCATQNTTSNSYTFTGCTLTEGTTYRIKVSAKNPPASPVVAINTGFIFKVSAQSPASFRITGSTGGADTTADDFLLSGTTVTANWNASSGATSYDVTIRNAADSADVCATQNTTETTYTFSGCALNIDTTYTIKVVAKNGSISTPAYNGPFSFLVPNAITFCPTGTSTTKALIIYDSGGPSGNYSGSQNCNFTISPPATASSIVLTYVSFDSNDNGDTFSAYDGTSSAGTLLGSYKNTAIAPSPSTATSGNMYLTWVSGSANHATGYHLHYRATYAASGSFSITGVQGGSDTTADSALTDNTSGVTVSWGASANAASYDVVIRNGSDTSDVCGPINTASTSYTFSTCNNLLFGASYVVTVYSKNLNSVPVAAANSPFTFTYTNLPAPFLITGATGGSDVTADAYLENGTTVTANWAAASGATSYDVTIFAADGQTQTCATTNVAGGATTSYTFSGCTLVTDLSYKMEVIAKNGNGSTLAQNSYFNFTLASAWVATSLTSVPDQRSLHTAIWTDSEMIIWGGSNTNPTYLNSGAKYNPTSDSWTTINSTNAPRGRDEHTAVWTGTEMIIWGGNDSNAPVNSGGRYNPSSNSWVPSSFTIFTERYNHSAVWTGSEMIMWGGTNGNLLNSGVKYNPSTDSWSHISSGANTPAGRYGHTAVWTGSEMIIWGGRAGATAYLNSGGRYTPSNDTWSPVSTGANAPEPRSYHTAVWAGSQMIIWGGYDGVTYYNNGGRYNPTNDTWTATSTGTNVPAGRSSHSAVWTSSQMIIWGGSNGTAMNTGGRYNPTNDTWTATSTGTNVPTARDRHSAVWADPVMIIFGGLGSGYQNSGGRYNPTNDTWTPTSTGTNVPAIRMNHIAVWTGTEMLIWGGRNSGTINSGARYNPTNDTWTPISSTGVPTTRESFAGVWTDTELIVWGGYSSGSIRNNGGRYNPSNDTWTAVGTGNTASPRYGHTAVWTGSEMVVWGGWNVTYLNSGGKYNPSTDTWTATSTGATVAGTRYGHTAVWTGSEMIVWGGYSPSSLNTGGKYNPTSDTWATTSTTSAPPGRYDHVAIWTGTEMIVWGGHTGSSSWDALGGRYNPVSDSWTATPNLGLPARFKHSAVWTGTEMIVWGGYVTSGGSNTGVKFNPLTNTIISTSTTNAPALRYEHEAVWTGSKMIIWGGFGGSWLNTGGVFTP